MIKEGLINFRSSKFFAQYSVCIMKREKGVFMKDTTTLILGKTALGLGVCGAVGCACYVTESAWPLLGLVFLPSVCLPEDKSITSVEVISN